MAKYVMISPFTFKKDGRQKVMKPGQIVIEEDFPKGMFEFCKKEGIVGLKKDLKEVPESKSLAPKEELKVPNTETLPSAIKSVTESSKVSHPHPHTKPRNRKGTPK